MFTQILYIQKTFGAKNSAGTITKYIFLYKGVEQFNGAFGRNVFVCKSAQSSLTKWCSCWLFDMDLFLQIKTLRFIPLVEKCELGRVLDFVEETFKVHWQGHQGFQALQERLCVLRVILEVTEETDAGK